MSRWLVLAVLSTALPIFGCGSSIRPGLSNAPRLGGTATTDNRITDVVSNGDDSCGLYSEHGTLRNRVPPCASSGSPFPLSVSQVPAPAPAAPAGALVEPWLDHFYVGWPCPAATSSRQTKSWSTPTALVATCSVP
ncbi:MAG TPA: hypothetical protein VK762_23915 [Polyangiaceae bacterium]|jgi:hypothetical protein|nr:hypothetical protein [Polyangiaceae bacterium]